MSLNVSPFVGLATTTPRATAATSATHTFAASALPFPSVRIMNIGAAPVFIQFIDTSNTVTVGVTNAIPILANDVAVLATGNKQAIGYISTGTTTIFITAGNGGFAE